MERKTYHFPNNTPTLRIPAGYVAITTEEYRDLVETLTDRQLALNLAHKFNEDLIDHMVHAVTDIKRLQQMVDDFEAYFDVHDWNRADLEKIIQKRREAEKAKKEKEAEDAAPEDS